MVRSTIKACMFLIGVFLYADEASADIESQVTALYANAVVKINVSVNEPVFVNDENICKSEGTGFVIGSQYVVTASHVLQLDPRCKDPIILVESKSNNFAKLAHQVGNKNDVAILKTADTFNKPTCALRLYSTDVYNEKAIRFGIPGAMSYPALFHVNISQKRNEFTPLLGLTPTIVEKGESGGPVVYQFNVVGITRAKHNLYPAFSVMTPGAMLRDLIAEIKIKLDGNICNPAEVSFYPGEDGAISDIVVQPSSIVPPKDTIIPETITQHSGEILNKLFPEASIITKQRQRVAYSNPDEGKNLRKSSVDEVQTDTKSKNSSRKYSRRHRSAKRTANVNRRNDNGKALTVEQSTDLQAAIFAINRNVEQRMWKKLVEEGIKSKKWPSDAGK